MTDIRALSDEGMRHKTKPCLIWQRLAYEEQAIAERDRINAEHPEAEASVGYLADDDWLVWVRAIPPFCFT